MNLPAIRIPTAIRKPAAKLAFRISRSKPEILLISGILLGGGALVVTATQTFVSKEILVQDFEEIKRLKSGEHPEYEDDDALRKAIYAIYGKTAFDIFKVYWKPVAMGAGSALLIVKSHCMLRSQLAEMTAMYAAAMKYYREQQAMLNNSKYKEVDPETGEEKLTPIEPETPLHSPYAQWITEGIWDAEQKRYTWLNPIYDANKLMLASRIQSIQDDCNYLLNLYGFLFLNTVLMKLGLPIVEEGWHVGWVKGGIKDGQPGDDYVDFGVFPDYAGGRYQLPVNKRFLDPKSNQKYPLLDFNCMPIGAIFKNILEYDNRSLISYNERNPHTFEGAQSSMDRFWNGEKAMERSIRRG